MLRPGNSATSLEGSLKGKETRGQTATTRCLKAPLVSKEKGIVHSDNDCSAYCTQTITTDRNEGRNYEHETQVVKSQNDHICTSAVR